MEKVNRYMVNAFWIICPIGFLLSLSDFISGNKLHFVDYINLILDPILFYVYRQVIIDLYNKRQVVFDWFNK